MNNINNDPKEKNASANENAASESLSNSENNFAYSINTMPGKVKKTRIFKDIFAPRNSSKTKMYILFIIGLVSLLFISYIAVNGVNFYGQNTYIQYTLNYFNNKKDFAPTTLILMLIVNLFWILTNLIIEFLTFSRKWIPERIKSEGIQKINLDHAFSVFKSEITFDETAYRNKITEDKLAIATEDKEEFDEILANPYLSPLAYFWTGLKAVFNFIIFIPKHFYIYWMRFARWNEKGFWIIKENIKHTIELIVYFLNPINLIEEIIDTAVTLLVKFFYPALLTPIIFFLPIRYGYYFEHLWQILVYFVLIGGLRLGVEFFSIYIRFLRNTRIS